MSYLKRLWTKVARFAEALEGIDDPVGHYMFFLEKRIHRLESEVEYLQGQRGPRPGGGIRH
ncbi:MAG: hypothetical protein AB7O88_10325 [Reyranellaceae bacterium]